MRRPTSGAAALLSLSIATGFAGAQPRAAACASERPTAESWPVTRSWDARAEREYGAWVRTLGEAVEAGRCRTLAGCLDRPDVNPLHVARRRWRFRADCGDVPYILRAYFSWRRGLPFVHTAAVRGERYDRRGPHAFTNRPSATRAWTDYATPRRLIEGLGSVVRSSFFRLRPELEDTDTYPARVDRQGVRPGTAFYDPDGHVLVVYAVDPDGTVRLIDGHPGGSFTARRFTDRITLGSSMQGGGFRNFRPVYLLGNTWVRPRNADLPDHDHGAQHDPARWVANGRHVGYHDWVRHRLTARR